jgi:hypothetical protein
MAWIRLDDQIAHHPKFLKAGPIASWLWVNCLGYAQKFLTDGFVPDEALPTLGTVPDAEQHADRLVEIRLLERVSGGYQIHDYLDFNESATAVKERRRLDRVRKESTRIPRRIQEESGGIPANVPRARVDVGVGAPATRSRDPIPSVPIPIRKDPPPTPAREARANGNGADESRSKRPIFIGQRVTVFEWMLDDCMRILGEHTERFDLHEWFFTLDGLAVTQGLVIPKRDGGQWLQSQLVTEAQRRGIPLTMAQPLEKVAGKLSQRLMSARANIRKEARP